MSLCPRIHFLLVRRVPPGLGPVLTEVYERLRERGALVSDGIPEETLLPIEEMAPGHDLYVLKSHTELALSMADTLATLGARLLNSHRSCLLTQDKITTNRLLARAGVPVPESWITGDYRLLRSLLTQGPLIAKPHRGHRGEGILILRDADDLDLISPERGPFIFQRYLSTGGEDLKAYVVGDEAFAVSKRFSPESFQIAGRPVELDSRTREVVRQGAGAGALWRGPHPRQRRSRRRGRQLLSGIQGRARSREAHSRPHLRARGSPGW